MKREFYVCIISLMGLLASCKNFNSTSLDNISNYDFEKYNEISKNLKQKYDDCFGSAENARSLMQDSELETTEDIYEFKENENSYDFLTQYTNLSTDCINYVLRIEDALKNTDSEKALINQISLIESEALKVFTENELDSIMYYAESVKTSISYFTDNGSIERSLWSKLKKNIKEISISAGLGAIVGGGVGYLVYGVPGAIAGAVGGAELSAYNAYKTGKICVFFPIKKKL